MSHILIIIFIIHIFVVQNSSAANDNVFELGIPELMRERNILDNRLQEVIQLRQEREDRRAENYNYRSIRINRVSDELRTARHNLERNQEQFIDRHYRAPEAGQFVEEQEEFIYEPHANRVDIEPNNIEELEQAELQNEIRRLEKEEDKINNSDAMSDSSYQNTMRELKEQEAQYLTERSLINQLLKDKKEEDLLDNIAVDSFHALENSRVAAAMQDNSDEAARTSTPFEQSVQDQNNMQQMHDTSIQSDVLEYEYKAFVNGIQNDDLRDNAPNLGTELENAANLEPLDHPENSRVAAAMQDNSDEAARTSTPFEQFVQDQNNMQQMHDTSIQSDVLEYEYKAFVNGIQNDDLRDNAPNLGTELENAANLEPLDHPENSRVAAAMQDNSDEAARTSTPFEQFVRGDDAIYMKYTNNMQCLNNDVDIFSVHSMEPMKTIQYNSILSNLKVGASLELNLSSSLNFKVLLGLNNANIYGAGIDYIANKRFSTGLSFMYNYGGSMINGTNAVNIKMDESISAFFTEAKYNFPLFNTPATTYISARFGIAQHILRSSIIHNNHTAVMTDTEDRAFAYGLGMGAEIPINHSVMIGLNYHINNFAFKNLNIDISQALPGNSISVKRDVTYHSINLLLKVVF